MPPGPQYCMPGPQEPPPPLSTPASLKQLGSGAGLPMQTSHFSQVLMQSETWVQGGHLVGSLSTDGLQLEAGQLFSLMVKLPAYQLPWLASAPE